jgi:hypothetical protein
MAPTTPTNARRLMTMTSLYASWVWTVTGCEMSIPRVFIPRLIHRYTTEEPVSRSESYKYDTTGQLASIAARLGDISVDRLSAPEDAG